MKKILMVLLAMVILGGCTLARSDLTLVSTRNVDLSRMAELEKDRVRVEGSDTKHIIIFVPTKQAPNIKGAIDEGLQCKPGCVALVDVVAEYKFWYIPLIYGQERWDIEGTCLIDPRYEKPRK